MRRRLVMLWAALRHPSAKSQVNVEADRHLDRLEKQVNRLSAENARRAREIVQQGR